VRDVTPPRLADRDRDADRDGLAAREGETLGDRRVRETELEGKREGETDDDASGDGDGVTDGGGSRRVATLRL
jgi:hypothetical protein